ncbi:hypothetical protein G3480_23965 [Thiorhodococcus mannitoliphagus]|uniref:Peptidoglycan binding-like domain-containing protein n=1 Tax=Thiorhodococcus mannitoliphagus TaxID=329406 RepID=A0A6P1E2L4_9GAMM|nr:peptidoglycan-binding domain-containing protein [Thiorhodococcus mannitoliphagus]NEX23316.1 hypothetical protein [Thiorhodococcus mannitoliphagus]
MQQLLRNKKIVSAAFNAQPFAYGENGDHVALFQKALFGLGYDLPRSYVSASRNGPEFDGIFGEETQETTRAFQTEQMLKDDAVVGEQTIFMISTRYGLIPVVVPHKRDLLNRTGRLFHSRAAVIASIAESFIKEMNFYLGTLKVSSDDYRRMRRYLASGLISVSVLSQKRFLNVKGRKEAVYETKNNRIVLREDRNYFTRLGQATCVHELTHAILDDRRIPIPTASRDEAIAVLAEAFYLTKRFRMSFALDRPSVHVPSTYTAAQPLIDAIMASKAQAKKDIRSFQQEVMRRNRIAPLSKYIYDGI